MKSWQLPGTQILAAVLGRALRATDHLGERGRVALQRTRAGRRVVAVGARLTALRVPRGAGVGATVLLIVAAGAYGAVRGEHVPALVGALEDLRDAAANAAGFRIRSVALSGQRQITREEILATAGVTGRTSLLFLDALEARERLKSNPWISDATVLKLYPGRLQIGITERQAFALWQKDGRVAVIADDGAVLESFVARRFVRLPMVVGAGAERKAKDFLALLERFPEIATQVRASILVAERRWNLKLKNGVDIRLPETDVEGALTRLSALERESRLTARDITAIDLRLPDRVTVRLSEGAAQARETLFNDKKGKGKGGKA
jgi:cell division protein FtsQ